MLACVGVKAQLAEGLAPYIGSQVTDLSAITTTDYYVLYNNGRSRFVSAPNADEVIAMKTHAEVDKQNTDVGRGSVVQFVQAEGEKTYKIRFSLLEKFMPQYGYGNTLPPTDEADAGVYEIVADANPGEFVLKGPQYNLNGNSGTLTGWTGTGGNSVYKIYKVTMLDATVYNTLTYNCTFTGGGLAEDLTYTQSVSDARAELNAPDVAGTILVPSTYELIKDVENNTATVNLTYTMNYPFTLSNPGVDGALNGATFYTAFLRNMQARAICHVDETKISCNTTRAIDAAYMWCFVADTEKPWQVKMYNLAAGKYLAVGTGNDPAACTAGLDEATSFNVLTNNSYSQGDKNYAGGLTLQHSGNANACLGAHIGGGVSVGTWNNGGSLTDEGSKMVLQPVGNAEFVPFDLNIEAPEFVGDPAAPSSLKDALDVYLGTPSLDNLNAYVLACRTASDAGQMTLGLEEGKYYRIRSNRGGNELITSAGSYAGADGAYAEAADGRKIARTTFDASDLSALWTPFASGAGFKLRNANSGLCMGQPTEMPLDDQWGGVWTLEAGTAYNVWVLKLEGSTYLNAWSGSSGTTLGMYGGGAGDVGNNWKIQLVTEVPVTIGAAGWSSLVLPYAVELPEGVQAYYAEGGVTGIELDLTEWTTTGENGKVVVPANMPVFLCGTPGEVNLTITTTEVAAPANTLKGFTMARHSDSGEFEGVYALRAGEDMLGKVTADVTDFPANRVFVEGVADGASLVRLAFGETTGIESVPAAALNAQNEVYYDLSGRRVWAPKNGIFVTASGRKVFIK